MEEDAEFNRFVRDALETGPAFHVPRRIRRRRALWPWLVPALLAASFSLTAIFRATFSLRSDRVSDAIELLSLTDDLEIEGETAGDLLLAWQDAPCAEML